MNQSMTGKHIFLFLAGGAVGAALMHFSMKGEATMATPSLDFGPSRPVKRIVAEAVKGLSGSCPHCVV